MAQYVYRRPPYPYYDMEGIESWLEDLITDGLWLDKDGFVFGMMQFRPGTPKKLKYRLEPIEKQSFLYLGQPNPPPEKALALYEEFGWEYLGTFYDFYIYRSMDENAVELNTDPTLQAQALRHVRRRNGYFLAFGITLPLIALAILISTTPLLNIINYGLQRTAWLLVFIVAIPIYYLVPYLHTIRLQKKLEQGEILTRSKDWRNGRFLRRLFISLPIILHCTTVYFNAYSSNAVYQNFVDPAEYSAPLPFVCLADISEERVLDNFGAPQLSIWSSMVTPTNIYWEQNGNLTHPEEERWNCELKINYHEAANEWIARELVREYAGKQARYCKQLNSPGLAYTNEDYRPEDYGFDELLVYDSLYDTILIIREGNHVVRASCALHTWGEKLPLFHFWLEEMAERYS